jgi:hypothetical protein
LISYVICRGAQRASDRLSKFSQSKCPANSHGRPAESPEWGWQRRKLSRWGGSCPTGLGDADPARTYPVLPDKGEPLPTCSHPPPKSEGVSKLIRPIKPTGVFGACMRKKQGSRNSPKGGLRKTAADRWRPSENREAPLGKLRERSRSCGNVPEVAATFAGALTADRGHGGSDHHRRSVSCPPCGNTDVLYRPCVVRRAGFRRGVGAATCRKFGRHRDSVLTDFAGINGGFGHR